MEGKIKSMVMGVILVVIAFIIIFQIISATASDLTTAADNVSASGLPLANLFGSSGVLLLIFMVAVFIGLLVLAFKGMKGN